MPVTSAPFSAWHPRRLPERPGSPSGGRNLYDRPPTPLFGSDVAESARPHGPKLARAESQQSLLSFHLAPDIATPPARQGLHHRALSIADRVPLPQGVSAVVAGCSAVAFALGVTTLIIGLHNRQMLLAATEARHDPHGPLANLIYTSVLHALRTNMTGAPFDRILPDPG